jgi:hypothetical protein
MISQIKQVPSYESMTAQEIYNYLAESITLPNMRGWTPKAILQEGRLTANELRLLVGTMQADPLTWLAAQWFATREEGLEFGSDERRAAIDAMSVAAGWEQAIEGMTDRVKALGRLTQTKWEQLGGMGTVPSVDAIAKALIISQCRDDMSAILQPIQAKSTALNAWLDSLDTSAKTVAEVQAYCSDLLASPDGNPSEVV